MPHTTEIQTLSKLSPSVFRRWKQVNDHSRLLAIWNSFLMAYCCYGVMSSISLILFRAETTVSAAVMGVCINYPIGMLVWLSAVDLDFP